MGWSRKAADLLRDARCVLHSTLAAPEGGELEVRVYGHAVAADAALRDARPEASWVGAANAAAQVFAAQVAAATLIEGVLSAAEVTARTWSPGSGTVVRRRFYP